MSNVVHLHPPGVTSTVLGSEVALSRVSAERLIFDRMAQRHGYQQNSRNDTITRAIASQVAEAIYAIGLGVVDNQGR